MSLKKIKVSPKSATRASFVPASYNAEKRTIDLIWTTGARVRRASWEGLYYEELSMKRSHVNLDRLKAGAPLLNNHGTGEFGGVRDLNDILGVVETAKIEGDQGIATVRFSERSDVAELIKDVISGVIRNVSVGYVVDKFEEVETKEESAEGIPVYRATNWTPMEISFVAIPADANAQTRNQKISDEHEAILETRGENTMAKKVEKKLVRAAAKPKVEEVETEVEETEVEETEVEDTENLEGAEERGGEGEVETPEDDAPAVEGDDEPEVPAVGDDAKKRCLTTEERQRGLQIRKAVRLAGLGEEYADKLVANPKMDFARASGEIFKELERKNGQTTNQQRIEVDMSQSKLRREAATRGLLHRADPIKYAIKDGENEFVQGTLIDQARHFLALEGDRNAFKGTKTEIAKRALHTTSDFSGVLSNVANKSLRDAYQGAPNTYMPFVNETTVDDFKEINSYQIGNGGKLEKVNEHGEYRRTSLIESGEKYRVEKFGLILGRTFELMVNDDLGAFTRVPARLGVRAREKENEMFWNLVLSNPVMAEDGNALFSAAHGNYVSSGGGAPDVTKLGVARKSMRLITDLDGELSGVTPSYLVLPASLETLGEQLLTGITPNTNANVNPFGPTGRSRLDMIIEPRLDVAPAAWYLFADKNKAAMAEMARLDGKGPEIFVREGFEIDGHEVKIRYIFGMKILDWRGFYKNIGA